MKKIILIFDFDGTLADTFNLILKISNQLAKEFKFHQIHPEDVHILKDRTLEEVIKHLQVPIFKIPLILAKARREFYKEIITIKPFPELGNIIFQLKTFPIQMGILTTNSTRNVHKFLKQNKLEIFDFIHSSSKIFGKDVTLKKIAKRKHLPLKQIYYIGDETRDIAAAQKAGVKTIAVSWGYNSEKVLLKQKPDFLIKDPIELLKLLQEHINL